MEEGKFIDREVIAYNSGTILSIPKAMSDGSKQPSTQSADELQNSNKKWAPWGSNDDVPNLLKKDAEQNTIVLPGIRLASKLIYGGGLSIGKTVIDEKGKRDWQYVKDKGVDKWMRANNFAKQLFSILYDITFYGNAFPMFTLSLDGKTITRLSVNHSRALFTRLSPINQYGEHEMAFINADFGNSSKKEGVTIELPAAPEFGAVQWIRNKVKPGKSFILPIKSIDAGRQNYSLPDWNSAREMKWLEIGKDIAALNKAYLANSMRPLWHIEVHPDFWPTRYGAEVWIKMSAELKKSHIDKFHSDLMSKLGGVDNAGSYISTPLAMLKGFPEKAYELVKITCLENKVDKGKDGWYLTTSREAGQHLVVSMGLDSAMMGTIPGDGSIGGGSGSNNRVAYNQRVLLSKPEQDMYLNFMYMVAEYNGWNEELEFVIEQGLITTLDQGGEATRAAAPADVPKNVNGNG